MSIVKQEIKNTKFMVNKLATSVNKVFTDGANNLSESDFKDVKNDDCETRSRGICTHDTIATEALNLIPTLADVNWEVFVKNLSKSNLDELKYSLSENTIEK
jgi:hypothetical protein